MQPESRQGKSINTHVEDMILLIHPRLDNINIITLIRQWSLTLQSLDTSLGIVPLDLSFIPTSDFIDLKLVIITFG